MEIRRRANQPPIAQRDALRCKDFPRVQKQFDYSLAASAPIKERIAALATTSLAMHVCNA